MRGDDLVPEPAMLATRAITIAGRPEDIWPWIVQIGYDRAGFYGYDLIENIGSKSGMRSADTIVPDFQRLTIGDRVYMSRIAYLRIGELDSNRTLIWADEVPRYGAFTFSLDPVDDRRTRLVVRTRLRYHWTDSRILLDLFTEFGDHVAVPRMLLGIRDRVEGRTIPPLTNQGFEIAIWIAAMVEFGLTLILILTRRSWWKSCGAAMLAGAALLFVLYARQPLWLGALLQIPVMLAVVRAWRSRVMVIPLP
jgi:hypothetical protein